MLMPFNLKGTLASPRQCDAGFNIAGYNWFLNSKLKNIWDITQLKGYIWEI